MCVRAGEIAKRKEFPLPVGVCVHCPHNTHPSKSENIKHIAGAFAINLIGFVFIYEKHRQKTKKKEKSSAERWTAANIRRPRIKHLDFTVELWYVHTWKFIQYILWALYVRLCTPTDRAALKRNEMRMMQRVGKKVPPLLKVIWVGTHKYFNYWRPSKLLAAKGNAYRDMRRKKKKERKTLALECPHAKRIYPVTGKRKHCIWIFLLN